MFKQNIGRAQRSIGRAQMNIGRAWALPGLYKTTPLQRTPRANQFRDTLYRVFSHDVTAAMLGDKEN